MVSLGTDGDINAAETVQLVFSAVRFRTDVARRTKRRAIALNLVFRAVLRLNGGQTLKGLLVDGARFEDGILAELRVSSREAVIARSSRPPSKQGPKDLAQVRKGWPEVVKRLRLKLGDDATNRKYGLTEPRVSYRMAHEQ